MGLFRSKQPTESQETGAHGSDIAGASDKAEETKDLTKLKKKELLEIMLRQGEEIDNLRARITELEQALEDKEIKVLKAGSMAEAAMALNGVFEAADKAALDYVESIRRKIDGR